MEIPTPLTVRSSFRTETNVSEAGSAGRARSLSDLAPLRLRDDDLVLFAHIPKTAGTSVIATLRTWFPDGSTFEIGGSMAEARVRVGMIDTDRIRLVAGHMADGPYRPLFRARARYPICITVLRDPVERLLSLFSHIMRRQTEDWQLLLADRGLGLKDFLRSRILAEQTDNLQTRMIAGALNGNLDVLEWSSGFRDRQAWLEIGKQRLEQFACVGVTENLDSFLASLANRFGMPAPAPAPRLNATPRQVIGSLDDEARGLLEQRTAFDRELYEHARLLVDRRSEDLRSSR